MVKVYSFFIFLISLVSANRLIAQRNVVQVDQYSGTASVVIPIYAIKNGSISTQINLVNQSVGVKVKDVEGIAGIGWQMSGGGMISREIRGLPDDCQKDNANNIRLGWLYNSNGVKIDNFAIANDGNVVTCTDETTDLASLNTNFSDTEPDLFSINAPGLSVSFVFDKNHQIQTIPYQDLKITYTTSISGEIEKFVVVNDQGVSYEFDNTSTTKSTKQTLSTFDSQSVSESSIVYFKTRFLQYKSGISSYNNWYLKNVTDANLNAINFSYTDGLAQNNVTPIELYIGTAAKATQYWIKDESFPRLLSSIWGGGTDASFTYNNNYYTSQSLLSKIKLSSGANYLLNYSSVMPLTGYYSRFFLRDITTDQCNSPAKYQFSYTDETFYYYYYKTSLGDSSSKNIDYWGHATSYSNPSTLLPGLNINPSNASFQRYQIVTDNISRPSYTVNLSGAERRLDPAVVGAGSVSKITYLDNGSTTMIYEPHDYYDPTAGAVVQGGGIRIKQIVDYDGINVAHNMVRNYSYSNPSTGITSGKPSSLPVYGFTRPYTGTGSNLDLWSNATVRSELDLSPNDHSIVYAHVKEAKNGSGFIAYEYYTPATNYDTSAFPSCVDCITSDWSPTVTFIARPGCATAGFMTNDKSTYPFAPNTNYDFERGLVKSVKVYNEAGGIVDETEYSYQRIGAPISVTGLRWDENGGFKAYSKYTIYTSTGELTKKVVQKRTDLPPYSQVRQSSSSYFYDSPFHHLSTRQEVANSDGTITKAFVKYVKDYNTGTINDAEVSAIHQLQLQNQNIPIEQYTQVQKPNNELKVTSGSLLKFKAFNFGSYSLYMPSQKLGFVSQNGITGFTTSSSSSGIFTYDPNYIPLESYLIYDSNGFLQTKDDHHKQVQTSLSSSVHHLPVAYISNAAADEIGYYNPNHLVDNSTFNVANGITGPYLGRAGVGSGSSTLDPGVPFSKVIKKNKNAKNYIFSIWLDSYGSGTFSITLTGTDNVPHVYPLNFTANNGTWKYYEIKVPVVNLSPTFNIDVQHNTTSVLFLTDVLFYPENAEVSTSDYRTATLSKIVQTNTNGISEYYASDNLGRLSLVYDQDKQIKARTSYLYQDTYQTFSDPTFSFSPVNNIIAGTDVRFYNATNYNPCQFTGITFTWDFGDGTAPLVTSSTLSLDHRYAVAGTYNVTLTVSALGQSNKSTKAVVVVLPPPIPEAPQLVIPVNYVNNSSGEITSIQLSQDGVVKYTFTGDELLAGDIMVPAQSYRVRVFCSGSYGSVKLDDGGLNYCSDYGGFNSYSFFANLIAPRSLTITIGNGNCN